MEAKIRLDHDGSPYLAVSYTEGSPTDATAADDAERLFFSRLNQNGGSIYLVPGRGKTANLLVVTGTVKRKVPVLDTRIDPPGMPTAAEINTLRENLDGLMAPPPVAAEAAPAPAPTEPVDVTNPNLQDPSIGPVS